MSSHALICLEEEMLRLLHQRREARSSVIIEEGLRSRIERQLSQEIAETQVALVFLRAKLSNPRTLSIIVQNEIDRICAEVSR